MPQRGGNTAGTIVYIKKGLFSSIDFYVTKGIQYKAMFWGSPGYQKLLFT